MSKSYQNLSIDCHGNIFVITLQKPPENRLNTQFAQEIIRAFRDIEKQLGPDSEGAIITRGNDDKFWCTV
jgi:enoyl-CoA hydratase/carnithine racemase